MRRKPSLKNNDENSLLNYTLELAQEWGDDWLKPIQERLGKAYPSFTQEQLENYNTIAQAAMKLGHDLVYNMAEKQGREKINQEQWEASYLSRFPWVDKKNLSHLFSTGMYYAMKDGIE